MEEMDIIDILGNGFVHILEIIFVEMVNYRTFLKVQQIPRYETLLLPVWKKWWQRKIARSPVWRMLSSRAKHYDVSLMDKLNHRDVHYYRDQCLCIEDRFKAIRNSLKNGFHHQTKETTLDFSEPPIISLFHIPLRSSIKDFVVNYQNIFVVLNRGPVSRIIMLNRWTLTETKRLDIDSFIPKLKVNSLFAIFPIKDPFNNSLYVYDVNTLELIQIINAPSDDRNIFCDSTLYCFCLTESFLYYAGLTYDMSNVTVTINVLKLNHASNHFEMIEKRSFEYESCSPAFDAEIYVDDKHLILDCNDFCNFETVRRIQVRCVKTMDLIHYGCFSTSTNIKKEYKQGKILVETKINQKDCVAVWDARKNTCEYVIKHPISDNFRYILSTSMTHFTNYQILIKKGNQCKVQLVRKNKCLGRCLKSNVIYSFDEKKLDGCTYIPHLTRYILYCDGAQLIVASNRRPYLMIVDLI